MIGKRLLWSGEGRTEATLEAFFDFLGAELITAPDGTCLDMWRPYIDVIKTLTRPPRGHRLDEL